MKNLKRQLNRLPVAPVIAAMFAAAAAVLIIAMPHWLFEYYVQRLGLPGLIPAAAPPLGDTARIAAAGAVLVLGFGVLWTAVTFIEKAIAGRSARREPIGSGIDFSRPILSAGPPLPVSATSELGAPLMSDEAMAEAREELILESAMIEPELIDAAEEAAPPVPIDPEYAVVEAVETPVARIPIATESLSALMNRLERSLLAKPAGWRPRAARSAAQ